jgi:putative SOS response-associated peptidase YedK
MMRGSFSSGFWQASSLAREYLKRLLRTLDTGTHKAEEFRDLFKPYPSRAMEAYQVSTRVNKPGYDSPGLNKPIPVED